MKNKLFKKIITSKNSGKRLDIFLAEELKTSRSQVQKLITQKQIFVNEKLPKKGGDFISEKDIVELKPIITTKKEEKETKKIKTNTDSKLFSQIKIISETKDYIVLQKPSGLLTHGASLDERASLSSYLIKKYPELKKIGEDEMRPGIVHRLDKEASGLLVVARTQKMFESLKDQFKKRIVDKEYLVLAHGRVAKDVDTISFPISRSNTSDRMAAKPTNDPNKNSDLKEAFTEFFVEKRFVNFTLLRVKILTGRMHQIRVHLLAYNHPVVGDPLYFQKKRKDRWDKKLGRLFLHCTKIGFTDLTHEKQLFESPLPKELSDFLKLLT